MKTDVRNPRGPSPAALTGLATALAAGISGAAFADSFKVAPPLKLPGLDGKVIEMRYDGAKVTLVNFWATWCLPCREEMPLIDRIFRKYKARGFQAAGVALESGEAAEIKDFLAEGRFDLTYPILMGTEEFAYAYGDVSIVPTTYLVGPKGEVLKTYFGVGGDFEKSVGADIEKLLAEGGGPKAAPPRKSEATHASAAAPAAP